jgi:hypothetical protein
MVVVTFVSSQTATQSGRQNAHSHGVPLPLQKPERQYESLIHFVPSLTIILGKNHAFSLRVKQCVWSTEAAVQKRSKGTDNGTKQQTGG